MKIGVMTTWQAPCGISTYSEELYGAIYDSPGDHPEIVIFAPHEAGMRSSTSISIPVELGCWTRQGYGMVESIVSLVERHGIDVVHIQHEFGLFKNPPEFRRLFKVLRSKNVKTVITLHTVFPYPSQTPGFYETIRSLADVVVVHTVQARSVMEIMPGPAKIWMIPHGTDCLRLPGNREAGLDFIGVPQNLRGEGVVVALVFGFIGPSKNIECTLAAYSKLRSQYGIRNLALIICGSSMDPYYGEELVPELIRRTGYDHLIAYHPGFVPVERTADVMAAADFGILNERGMSLSASGQVHLYAAHGVPLVVADVPKHTDAVMAGAVPFQVDQDMPGRPFESCMNAIGAMAVSERLRRKVGLGMADLAKRTDWRKIGQIYHRLYTSMVEK